MSGTRRLLAMSVAGLAVLILVSSTNSSAATPPPGSQSGGAGSDDPTPAAVADAPWWPEYDAIINYSITYSTTWLDFFRQVGVEKMQDATSDFINVSDGRRATWSAPSCPNCPRFRVWFYGSSTGFGLGQRDDHTVPSELAKAAWDEGIVLEVINRSSPGDQHSHQADRLAWDLTRHEPPDAVVFYSGVSEVNVGAQLAGTQVGDVDRPVDLIAESFMNSGPIRSAIDEHLRGGEERPEPPDGVRILDPSPAPQMEPSEVGQLAVDRYRRTLPMSRDLVSLYRLNGLWVWEPMRLSRPATAGEPVIESDNSLREVVAAASLGLPEDVLDLSGVLASDPRPFFYDDVHHNEAASEIIGAAIAQALLPQLLGS